MSVIGEFRLGFVALTDAAPLLVADALGFFDDEHLSVELARSVSWATIRDQLAADLIDGAHMLAPMALAARLGVGGVQTDLIVPMALNVHGAAVALAEAIARTPPGEWTALAKARRNAGRPLTFGVVFPFSTHAYLMRDWLVEQGLDPDHDVRLVVAAPTAMVERLVEGVIDGFCVGAPWHEAAQRAGLGQVVRQAAVQAPFGPDKVFAMRQTWAERNPEAVAALLRALVRAGRWADDPANLDELATLLSAPERVGGSPGLIAAGLAPADPARIQFSAQGLATPNAADAVALLRQMRRWGQIGEDVDVASVAATVYRPEWLRVADVG